MFRSAFYYISARVGWCSSVSIMRIIYHFKYVLNWPSWEGTPMVLYRMVQIAYNYINKDYIPCFENMRIAHFVN